MVNLEINAGKMKQLWTFPCNMETEIFSQVIIIIIIIRRRRRRRNEKCEGRKRGE